MGRSSALLLLLPQEALVLVVVVGAFLVMLRLASFRAVLGSVLVIALLPLLAPLFEALLGLLPMWLSLAILLVSGFWFLQTIATLILGRRAAAHMVGTLAADLVRFFVVAAFFPIRLLWRVLRQLSRNGGD
jgi:hypothetical protein